ncbi:hypothetical protein PS903_04058 [Pseudomonas fluorescens]|nr:hypothetical protein PS903_04058 [Pseudomonas fluorescens]
MSLWLFWGVTAVLALLEWLGSCAFAAGLYSGKKGLMSDLLAATVMVVFGLVFELVGNSLKIKCVMPQSLIELIPTLQADVSKCLADSKEVVSFGEMLTTTLGMNSVLAALVLYSALKLGFWLLGWLIQYLGRRGKL